MKFKIYIVIILINLIATSCRADLDNINSTPTIDDLLVTSQPLNSNRETNYNAFIESYNENGSYIEYPQISGLRDLDVQNVINKMLKEEVWKGPKDYQNKPFVDFTELNYTYEYQSGIGFTNNYIASFWYYFQSGADEYIEGGDMKQSTQRFFGITIDVNTGQRINLNDFMEVDEGLINSDDGDLTEPDYDSPVTPSFHRFKDAFMIYTTKEEEDTYHIFTPEETIERLTDPEGETNWYIDEEKNMVFYFGSSNSITVPFTKISDAIHYKYRIILES